MLANSMEVHEALRTNLIKVPYCLGEDNIIPLSSKNSCQPEKCRNQPQYQRSRLLVMGFCFKLVYFSEKSGHPSSAGPEFLAFVNDCSANFQLVLDCYIPKLKYKNSENIKADCVSRVRCFNTHQIKQMNFLGTPVRLK